MAPINNHRKKQYGEDLCEHLTVKMYIIKIKGKQEMKNTCILKQYRKLFLIHMARLLLILKILGLKIMVLIRLA